VGLAEIPYKRVGRDCQLLAACHNIRRLVGQQPPLAPIQYLLMLEIMLVPADRLLLT
jgi:hypothetical protein